MSAGELARLGLTCETTLALVFLPARLVTLPIYLSSLSLVAFEEFFFKQKLAGAGGVGYSLGKRGAEFNATCSGLSIDCRF